MKLHLSAISKGPVADGAQILASLGFEDIYGDNFNGVVKGLRGDSNHMGAMVTRKSDQGLIDVRIDGGSWSLLVRQNKTSSIVVVVASGLKFADLAKLPAFCKRFDASGVGRFNADIAAKQAQIRELKKELTSIQLDAQNAFESLKGTL